MGYICVEERVSEAPPCGCAAYMWLCGVVCAVAGERESECERGRGRGGGGEREKQPFVKTTRQAQHTKQSTLEERRSDSSIHPKSLSE